MEKRTEKPHYHVTAGVIWRDGKVLITTRPKGSHMEGLWEFPGGKQEKGETLEDCLEREFLEELGMVVNARRHLLSVDHDYEDRYITLHFFECSHFRGNIRLLEGQEARWVPPESLSDFSFPPADYGFIEWLTKGR